MKPILRTIVWRYLFSREEGGAATPITFVSLAGVAIGVAVLIATMGVMDGADRLLSAKISNLYAHIRIQSEVAPEAAIDPVMLDKIRAQPEVTLAEPIIRREALLMAGGGTGVGEHAEGVTLVSARRLGEENLYRIDMHNKPVALAPGQLLAGEKLLERLGAKIGDTIQALTPNTGRKPISMSLQIVGTFASNYYEFDSSTAFVAEDTMRAAFGMPHGADYIHVALKDPAEAGRVKDALLRSIPDTFRIMTWSEVNDNFFEGLKWQKRMLFLILLMIVIVAAFNIIGSLILMVIAKTRQIGILKAIGATRREIVAVFLADGCLIGVAGTLLGLVIGLAICAALPHIDFGISEQVYNFSRLPVEVRPGSALAVMAASVAICALASLLPALQAGRLSPVEALRYD